MAMHRWLGLSWVMVIAAAFAACSNGTTSSGASSATGTSSGNGSGGAGSGGAGSGGAASSTGTGKVDAGPTGPIVCKSTSSFSTVPKGNCDILQQNCPGGETCRPVQGASDFVTECVGGTGLKTAGELCVADSECDAKLFCISTKCTPVCCRDNDEPCNGGICNINVKFGTHAIFLCHYAPKCELLVPDACAPGLDCHIEDAKQSLATCGEPNGKTVPELAACLYINDCATMQECFKGDNVCHYYCRLSGGTGQAPGLGGCPAAEDCLDTYNGQALKLGVPGIGLCFPNGSPPPDAGGD